MLPSAAVRKSFTLEIAQELFDGMRGARSRLIDGRIVVTVHALHGEILA